MDNRRFFYLPAEVSRALIYPLLARARETLAADPLVKDPLALSIAGKLDLDAASRPPERVDLANRDLIVRTALLDQEIRRQLRSRPSLIMINLGAGLDTRFSRVDNGRLTWYDLDLPDVIHLRQQYLPGQERCKTISRALLDDSWMRGIEIGESDDVVLIADNLLPVLGPQAATELLHKLAYAFAGARLYLDVIRTPRTAGPMVAGNELWCLRKATDIEKISSRISLIRSWRIGDLYPERQSLLQRLLNRLPWFGSRRQILLVQFRTAR